MGPGQGSRGRTRIGTGDRNKNGELEHQGLGAKINEAEKAKAGVVVQKPRMQE